MTRIALPLRTTRSRLLPCRYGPEYFLFETIRRRLIQALGNQHGVSFDVNDDRPRLR